MKSDARHDMEQVWNIQHAACFAYEIEMLEMLLSKLPKHNVARLSAMYCAMKRGIRPGLVAKAFGVKVREVNEAVKKIEAWQTSKERRINAVEEVLGKKDAKCEVVIVGSEVFGLTRKRERSRQLSRKLCEAVGMRVDWLNDELQRYCGMFIIGSIGRGRPNARNALIDGKTRYLVLLVEPNGKPVGDGNVRGVFTVRQSGREGCELANFYIDKPYRGHSFGTQMLKKFIARFKEDVGDREETLVLEVNCANEVAQRLYRAAGFSDWAKKMELRLVNN